MSTLPSVSNLPLSEKRIKHIIAEIVESFNASSIGRKIIKPVTLTKNDPRRGEEGFVSFGFNHILDRIWFVDGVFEGASYAYQGIGRGYGVGIAEAETLQILKCIFEKCKSRVITYKDKVHPSDVLRATEILSDSKADAKIILTDVQNHLQLWLHPNLQGRGRFGIPKSFSGMDHDVEAQFFRGLPAGTLMISDPDQLGELLIKESLEENAKISDIEHSEEDKILKEIPTLARENLSEKVKLIVYETVKINILNPNGVVILKKEEAENSTKPLVI